MPDFTALLSGNNCYFSFFSLKRWGSFLGNGWCLLKYYHHPGSTKQSWLSDWTSFFLGIGRGPQWLMSVHLGEANELTSPSIQWWPVLHSFSHFAPLLLWPGVIAPERMTAVTARVTDCVSTGSLPRKQGVPALCAPSGVVWEHSCLGSHRGDRTNETLNLSSALLYFRAHLGKQLPTWLYDKINWESWYKRYRFLGHMYCSTTKARPGNLYFNKFPSVTDATDWKPLAWETSFHVLLYKDYSGSRYLVCLFVFSPFPFFWGGQWKEKISWKYGVPLKSLKFKEDCSKHLCTHSEK